MDVDSLKMIVGRKIKIHLFGFDSNTEAVETALENTNVGTVSGSKRGDSNDSMSRLRNAPLRGQNVNPRTEQAR